MRPDEGSMFILFWGTHRVESKLKPVEAFCPVHQALHDLNFVRSVCASISTAFHSARGRPLAM
jgi:hypothetical protein